MSTLASFQNQVKPNWCPGCGDYAVQMALQQAAVKLNLEPHQLALVSGIGCSGRIGGYLYAYGIQLMAALCLLPRALSWQTLN